MKILGRSGPALLGLIAGAAVVGFALPALGDDAPPHGSAPGGPHPSPFKAFTSKSSGLKVRYVAGQSTVQPSAEDGFTLKCPKKTPHAISSFFGPGAKEGVGQIALTDSFPLGKGNRSWDIGVKNLGAAPVPYYAGVVCIQ